MIKAVKGTRDILPPASAVWNRVEAQAREVFRTFNYHEIRTPIFEETALFARGVGEDTDIVALRTERDDPTYLDDAVEIFINPRPSQTAVYFGLEMNARAVLYDYVMVDAKYAFKRFNMQGVQLASSIRGTLNMRGDEDKGWSLEVAIPWANFEELSKRPTPGAIWTANLPY